MTIAISNIAWNEPDESVSRVMREFGVAGVEIAPTKVWPAPLEATESEVRAYRDSWDRRGIRIVALQSLLFGRLDLTLFQSGQARAKMFEYLAGVIRLGSRLGASVCVFGSPKNRLAGTLNPDELEEIAVPFFRDVGQVAAENGLTFCLEPNPTIYGCDYITNSQEGLELARKVNSPGFGLHLDAAAMTASQETVPAALSRVGLALKHFHASEIHLAPIGAGTVNHNEFAAALRQIHYTGWVSIEMRSVAGSDDISRIRDSLRLVSAIYGEAASEGAPVADRSRGGPS